MERLLIANRGEVAIRIAHAAAELGLRTVAVFSSDDRAALHVRRADHAFELAGVGAAPYLDIEQLIHAARRQGCDSLHPGYGFLSESAELARQCNAAGLTFVGPTADTLEILGDKVRARALARHCQVPVLAGLDARVDLDQARAFLDGLSEGRGMVIKAVAGGGGRGMRVVHHRADVEEAFQRCQSEAARAFGNDALYVEEHLPHAHHVEVQVLGDGTQVIHLGERDCSVQRRHQKMIEIAPSPWLGDELRRQLISDALRMGSELDYRNAGTFEFLVGDETTYAFIEANPRLQVEHTVSEEVWGVDLVRSQLEIAAGKSLADLGLSQDRLVPRGFAVQLRINAETIGADGSTHPSAGTIARLEFPSGHGIRVDTAAHVGLEPNHNFDSLLAKLVVHSTSPMFEAAIAKARRALSEVCIEGTQSNRDILAGVLGSPAFRDGGIHTEYVTEHLSELGAFREGQPSTLATRSGGSEAVCSPIQGTVVSIAVRAGDSVARGQSLAIINAMKMEHVIAAPQGGTVDVLLVAEGETVAQGTELMFVTIGPAAADSAPLVDESELSGARADLLEVQRRHDFGADHARPDAVARRRRTGQRTARENIADLCDRDSFVEYGGLVIAAQRQRRSLDDLIERTPADGLVTGVGRINGESFGESSRCAVLAYDYTVLAGTQGFHNHRKKDRLFELAERLRLPVVFFTEGGGGRPGDTDAPGVAGLDCMAFHLFGRLSGLVPLVAVNSGRCFAGNAALLGCCDVVIATRNSNIGMGGPAMIEGGGLGVYRPEEVGPAAVQVRNGVIDIAVADEAEAVRVARQYLSYFQGSLHEWSCADQTRLRGLIPENRLRVYDVRGVIEALADSESVLELRRDFGIGMVTSFIRIEGRAVGVVANNPTHLAGAIDSAGADKAARFLQLCDAFDISVLFLCDTPGMMVGPEAEKTALVRHCCRLFVIGASLTVPFGTIVLRKSYGLGAQAMGGGSHKAPLFVVSWPTGEFGGMGLEGAVKLGFRKELEAIEDPAQREQAFERMVARAYEHGKAVNTASHFEIDDVIDPADSRRWIREVLLSQPVPRRDGKKRPCVDTW